GGIAGLERELRVEGGVRPRRAAFLVGLGHDLHPVLARETREALDELRLGGGVRQLLLELGDLLSGARVGGDELVGLLRLDQRAALRRDAVLERLALALRRPPQRQGDHEQRGGGGAQREPGPRPRVPGAVAKVRAETSGAHGFHRSRISNWIADAPGAPAAT